MAKGQFQQSEVLQVRFPAFINGTTGAYIIGTDTATVSLVKPGGAAYAGNPVAMSFNATSNIWSVDIPTVDFVVGEWQMKAVSNDAAALPQFKILHWGDYVDDVTATRKKLDSQLQRNLGEVKQSIAETFVVTFTDQDGDTLNAIVATDVTLELLKAGAATSRVLTAPEFVFVSAGRYKIILPTTDFDTLGDLRLKLTDAVSGATAIVTAAVVASTAADAATSAAAADAKALIIRKIQTNRWKVDAGLKQFIVYDDDGVTPLYVFDIYDDTGVATSTRIYERVP